MIFNYKWMRCEPCIGPLCRWWIHTHIHTHISCEEATLPAASTGCWWQLPILSATILLSSGFKMAAPRGPTSCLKIMTLNTNKLLIWRWVVVGSWIWVEYTLRHYLRPMFYSWWNCPLTRSWQDRVVVYRSCFFSVNRQCTFFFLNCLQDFYDTTSRLWRDPGVQECFARASEYQLIDSAK